MTHRRAVIAALALALTVWTEPIAGQPSADEQSIRGLATQFERAWNSHDMNLLGAITTEDVDFVNVAGLHWKRTSRGCQRTRGTAQGAFQEQRLDD